MNINPRSSLFSTLICCLFVFLSSASFADEVDDTFSNGIRIVTGHSFPPYVDMEKEDGGIATDIVMSVLKKAFPQESVELHVEPWKRGYFMAAEAEYLGLFPLTKTEKREAVFHYSEPLLSLTYVLFTSEQSKWSYRQQDDLKGARICRPKGFNIEMIEPWLEQKLITLVQPETIASCFRMLSADRVDLVLVSEKIGRQVIQRRPELKSKEYKVLSKAVSTLELYLLVSRKEPNAELFLDRFNRSLSSYMKKYQYYFDVTDAPDKSMLDAF